jgi:DNA-binding NarL/FixJ family response regulator
MSRGVTDVSSFDTSAPSVVILSDVRFFREGLVEALSRDSALKIVGDAANLDERFDALLAQHPDIVLIDTGFPEGLSAVRRTRLVIPRACIVALALAETGHNVLVWAQAGATGYIPRTAGLNELVSTLQHMLRGEQPCSSAVSGYLLRRIADHTNPEHGTPQPGAPAPLTKRELQIVNLIDTGLSNKEIARRLNIGLATTKTHVHNILEKLQLERRSQAALWMREQVNQSMPPLGDGRSTASAVLNAPQE